MRANLQPSAKSLAAFVMLAFTASAVVLGSLPATALVVEAIGIPALRVLSAVGGALWEGARPPVVDFGADAANSVLTALRQRLKIPPRRRR